MYLKQLILHCFIICIILELCQFLNLILIYPWQFEDTKGVIRSRKSKDRQYNDQKNKQRSTKYYTVS
jgi:hypothetical protein